MAILWAKKWKTRFWYFAVIKGLVDWTRIWFKKSASARFQHIDFLLLKNYRTDFFLPGYDRNVSKRLIMVSKRLIENFVLYLKRCIKAICRDRSQALFLNHTRVQSTNPLITAKYQIRVFHFLAHKIAITVFWTKN